MRRLDWCLILSLCIGLVAAWPFLTQSALPRQTDAELHVFRAAQIAEAVRGGVLYPRWAPDLYLGYGYPIFNYYAPFTYYLANLFNLLPGVHVVAGVKAVFVLGLVLAAGGTYLLARSLYGPAPALLGAACFTFSPYVVFIDPHARGDLAEHFAVCLLPLVLYTFSLLLRGRGGRAAFAGSVLSLGALMLSHNLMGIIGAVLLLLLWLWQLVATHDLSPARQSALAAVLAAALCAFFWLPALAEWRAVKLDVTGPGHFDFNAHFVSWSDLLAPSRILDLGATAPRFRFNLGIAQWVLALAAIYALVRLRPRAWTAYFTVSAAGLVCLMSPNSSIVWNTVPGMAYLQFPWRLLGPAALMLALCASAGAAALSSTRWRLPATAAALASVYVLALPVLYPPTWSADFGGTSPRDIIAWEIQSGAYGTTSTGDFVPTGAARVTMRPADTLLASYEGPGPIDKVNRATIPEGSQVEIASHGPLHDEFEIRSPQGFILRLYTFHFLGWSAYVDGNPVEIEVAKPEGFITVPVPEGEHRVLVRFEDTPPRVIGWAASGAGALGLLCVLVFGRTWHRGSVTHDAPLRCAPDTTRCVMWLGTVTLAFVLAKSCIIDQQDGWCRYTSLPGSARGASVPVGANLGSQAELIGYDLPSDTVRAGDELELTLYWRAMAPLAHNYQSFVHVARPLNVLWGQEDHLNPGDLPTTRWPLDKYTWDEYAVRVLPGAPPGDYQVNVGLYVMDTGHRLPRLDAAGQAIADSVILTTIRVTRPREAPSPDELGMTERITATFSDAGVALLGLAREPKAVKLPGVWNITLFWRALRDQPAAQSRDLVLLDADGQEVWRTSGAPGDFPFGHWLAGDVVRDPIQYDLTGPAGLEKGWYTFWVVLNGDREPVAADSGETRIYLGEVKFRPRESDAGS